MYRFILFTIFAQVALFGADNVVPPKLDKPVTVNRPVGTYVVVQLQLQPTGAGDVKSTYRRATLAFRNGKGVSGMIPLDLPAGSFDASGLQFDGSRITGMLRDQLPGVDGGDLFTLQFDLTVNGSEVSGSFAFQNGPRQTKMKGGSVAGAHQGTVTGSIQGEKELRAAQAYVANADWPMWSGPNEDRLATTTETNLIDDFSKGRLVWRSEFAVGGSPGRAGGLDRKLGGAPWAPITGGGSNVVMHDSKVYAWRFRAAGETLADVLIEKLKQRRLKKNESEEFPITDKFKVSADDVMACIDAHTGQTIWETTLHDRGANWQNHKVNIMGHTPAVADGRIYAIGSAMTLYALDAQTGELLWERPSAYWNKRREEALNKKTLIYYLGGSSLDRSFGDSPIAFDNKVFVRQGRVLRPMMEPLARNCGKVSRRQTDLSRQRVGKALMLIIY